MCGCFSSDFAGISSSIIVEVCLIAVGDERTIIQSTDSDVLFQCFSIEVGNILAIVTTISFFILYESEEAFYSVSIDVIIADVEDTIFVHITFELGDRSVSRGIEAEVFGGIDVNGSLVEYRDTPIDFSDTGDGFVSCVGIASLELDLGKWGMRNFFVLIASESSRDTERSR